MMMTTYNGKCTNDDNDLKWLITNVDKDLWW